MKQTIKESTRLPKFIFILYSLQVIIVCFYLFSKDITVNTWYILSGILLIGILLFLINLKISFTPNALTYSLFPIILTKKIIAWKNIRSIQIKKTGTLSDMLGWGVLYSRKYGWAYITSAKYAILIKKNNGEKVVLSIKNKEKIMDFLNKNNIFQIS